MAMFPFISSIGLFSLSLRISIKVKHADVLLVEPYNDFAVYADSLSIEYGKVKAVNELHLEVQRGEVLGLLGGNGAGKSSTLRAVAGVNPATSGSLYVAGYNMSDLAGAESARKVTGYCPDVGGLVRQATVREHIGVALASRDNLDYWPYAFQLLELFGLSEVLDRETHGFSHGMSRRLSVLLAALTATEVLILDEPFDGVDPSGVEATKIILRQAVENNLGVIVSTHLLSLLVEVSDRISVMSLGRIVETGTADQYEGVAGATHYQYLLEESLRMHHETIRLGSPA